MFDSPHKWSVILSFGVFVVERVWALEQSSGREFKWHALTVVSPSHFVAAQYTKMLVLENVVLFTGDMIDQW